jgi:hypothetical protein
MPVAAKVTGTVRSKNPLKGAVEILPVSRKLDEGCFLPLDWEERLEYLRCLIFYLVSRNACCLLFFVHVRFVMLL